MEVGNPIIPGQELAQDHVPMLQQNNSSYLNAGLELAHIEPVSVQILSLTDCNNQPFHLELDNGATCSYILLQEAINCGFHIDPNSQSSQLGDRVMMIKSCGEVNVHL